MSKQIVVVGGYGHVGQTICRQLGELFPGNVFAAGRSLERAEQFSRATGGKVKPLQLDITGKIDANWLRQVGLVIMCLDQTNDAFVRCCLEHGVHYVDISATYTFLSQAENMHEIASAAGATAVLSVGVAPGLTNLLARRALKWIDAAGALDIYVMLSLGDQHGKAAIAWTIDNLGEKFEVIRDGTRIEAAGFTDGKETDFGPGIGRKRAYRFNFSDQHVLPRTLGVPSVSTRLCLDSAVATTLLAWLSASGAFQLLKRKPVRAFIARLLESKVKVGQERFAIKIDAWGRRGETDVFAECFFQGEREAETTAKVAVAVATAVYRSSFPHGVYHIEQLMEFEEVWHSIQHGAYTETRVNGKLVKA